LSMLFRRLMLEKLQAAHHQDKLRFFGDHQRLSDKRAFATYLAPLKKTKWLVYSKEPFNGPAATLAYLGRYTHRVAIANNRLIEADDNGVTFHYKDYRGGGRFKRKIMTTTPFQFIRRFLIHILPDRFHRIRHYGLFANGQRVANLHRIRALLNAAPPIQPDKPVQDHDDPRILRFPCPACGGRMIIIDSFEPGTDPPDYKTDTERINAA
ncbi:MAG: IS91 family transposase, partial [Geminicoccaceae bacterium]